MREEGVAGRLEGMQEGKKAGKEEGRKEKFCTENDKKVFTRAW